MINIFNEFFKLFSMPLVGISIYRNDDSNRNFEYYESFTVALTHLLKS